MQLTLKKEKHEEEGMKLELILKEYSDTSLIQTEKKRHEKSATQLMQLKKKRHKKSANQLMQLKKKCLTQKARFEHARYSLKEPNRYSASSVQINAGDRHVGHLTL